MAFTAITAAEIDAGEATKQELFDKIKDNFDDHETRIATNTSATSTFLPIAFDVFGAHYLTGPLTALEYLEVREDITLTSGRLFVIDSGSAGSVTVDVQKSATGGGAFATIFSVKPTLAFGAGDFATNNGTLSTTVLVTGDILRLDVDAFQTGNVEFHVYLEFNAT